jgi:5-methylcytosine-specific restriction endonuclease McrA
VLLVVRQAARADAEAAQVDHVRAVAAGGARFDPANLVASCVRCNTRRGRALRDELSKPRPSTRVGAIRL